MEISPAASPSQAIQRAFDRHAGRAERLAVPGKDSDFEKDMAELPVDKRDVGAQSKAIRAKDEMLGDLLDILV